MMELSQKTLPQSFAALTLIALLANLIIGGILLPYQQVKAQEVVVDYQLLAETVEKDGWDKAWETTKLAWEKVADAYSAAGTWITANLGIATWAEGKLQQALNKVWEMLKKKLLDMLVDDIINWIQGGGTPKIITDWQSYIKDAVSQTDMGFLRSLGAGFLCSGLSANLQIALAGRQPFSQRAACTLGDIERNITTFYNNFSAGGGWQSWISLTEPQNNVYGVYLSAIDQRYALRASAAQAAQNKGLAGAGFLGDEVCDEVMMSDGSLHAVNGIPMDQVGGAEGETCTKPRTRTPGKIAADAMSKAALLDIDYLLGIQSGTMSTYVTAIVNAVINRVIREGVTAIKTTSGSSGQSGNGITYSPSITIAATPYEDANQNSKLAGALIDQQNLLEENITKLEETLQTSVDLLTQQIKNKQLQTFDSVKSALAKTCALPGSLTSFILETQSIACPSGVSYLACQTEKIKISASGLGDGVFEITSGQAPVCYSINSDQSLTGDACLFASKVDQLSATAAIEPEITSLQNQISNRQSQNDLLAVAINANLVYAQTANKYINDFQASINGAISPADLAASETAAKNAKNVAITANQKLLGSAYTTFDQFQQQTQVLTQQIVSADGDAQMKRGGTADCRATTAGTYFYDICNAQSLNDSWQSTLNSCQAPYQTTPPNNY